jgi:hypothetical protein
MQVPTHSDTVCSRIPAAMARRRDPAVVDGLLCAAAVDLELDTPLHKPATLGGARVIAVPQLLPSGGRRLGWTPALVVRDPSAPCDLLCALLLERVGVRDSDTATADADADVDADVPGSVWVPGPRRYEAVWMQPAGRPGCPGRPPVFPLFSVALVCGGGTGAVHVARKRPREEALPLPVLAMTSSSSSSSPPLHNVTRMTLVETLDTQLEHYLGEMCDDLVDAPGSEAVGPYDPDAWWATQDPDRYAHARTARRKAQEKAAQNDAILGVLRDALGPGQAPRLALVLDDVDLRTTQAIGAALTIVPNFSTRCKAMGRAARRLPQAVTVWNTSMHRALAAMAADARYASKLDVVVADYCSRFETHGAQDVALLLRSPLLAPVAVLTITACHRGNRHLPRRRRTREAAAAEIVQGIQDAATAHGYRAAVVARLTASCNMLFFVFVVTRLTAVAAHHT